MKEYQNQKFERELKMLCDRYHMKEIAQTASQVLQRQDIFIEQFNRVNHAIELYRLEPLHELERKIDDMEYRLECTHAPENCDHKLEDFEIGHNIALKSLKEFIRTLE